jgi:hypothetical protein
MYTLLAMAKIPMGFKSGLRGCPECYPLGNSWATRRLYVRSENGKRWVPIGWICSRGHVQLDDDAAPAR